MMRHQVDRLNEIANQMKKLVEKARKEWHEDWSTGMMDYNKEYNEIVVYVGRMDVYKAGFDADTLACKWTKC